MAAERILIFHLWYGGAISTNLEVIWEMSVEISSQGECDTLGTEKYESHGS